MSAGAALAVAAAALATVPASAAAPASGAMAPGGGRGHAQARWVNAWQGSPVPGGTIPGPAFNCPADTGADNQTVRNIVFLSTGGDRVRVRLTNAFGARPLRIGAASVAIAGTGAATVPGSGRPLRFAGGSSILIAAGGEALSDPVSLNVTALQRLDISVYLPAATGPATQHFFAQQDNYLASGNRVGTSSATGFTTKITCWMFADGVDVQPSQRVAGTVVTLGDSITDGFGSTTNANRRYPDDLARRLNGLHGRTLSVSNAGIGGNELLTFRTDQPFAQIFGPPAPARLPRDVLAQAGARSVILLEGINDIGADAAKAADLIQVDQQIIAQAHAAGLRIYGATLVPFGGSNGQYGGQYGTAAGERQRQLLNHWIRTSGAFDAVFDFDKAIRDPQHPDRMLPQYDSGDHLHPSDAGYQKMAATVNLALLLHRTP
jgi:lysophospholipase L1-like esterase